MAEYYALQKEVGKKTSKIQAELDDIMQEQDTDNNSAEYERRRLREFADKKRQKENEIAKHVCLIGFLIDIMNLFSNNKLKVWLNVSNHKIVILMTKRRLLNIWKIRYYIFFGIFYGLFLCR